VPDDVDRSCEEQDFNLQLALMRQRVAAAAMRQAMPAVGLCYNCREPVAAGLLYCDKDCEADDTSRRRR
jgi:hypothetical protein